jgi:hypothetical protein
MAVLPTALPAVKTLRLHHGGLACFSLLRALSASANPPTHPESFRSPERYAASFVGLGSVDVAGAVAGSAMVGLESVKENVGAELVGALKGGSGLGVVLTGCEVDEEALEALRKRARVEIGDKWVYMQEYM